MWMTLENEKSCMVVSSKVLEDLGLSIHYVPYYTYYTVSKCSLLVLPILDRLSWMKHWVDCSTGLIISLPPPPKKNWAQEWKHIYSGACRQSQVLTVNTPPPSTPWAYLRNTAFLTGTAEKINWSSILRIQSTYHPCKPKNTLAQWPSPLLHTYKMWKRSHKFLTSSTTTQLLQFSPKGHDLLFIINTLSP